MRLGVAIPRAAPTVVAGVGLRTLAAFALTKVAAAALGPTEFGRYGHYLILASYLVTASSFGLGNALTVYAARRRAGPGADPSPEAAAGEQRSVVAVGALTGSAIAVVFGVLATVGALPGFLPELRGGDVGAWMAFCVANGVGAAYLATLLGGERHRAYQALTTATPVVSCLALLAAARAGSLDAETAAACYMAGYFLPAAVFLLRARWRRGPSPGLAPVLRFALPYLAPGLLTPTLGAAAVLGVRRAVETHATAIELGWWQALWRVGEAYMGVIVAVCTALFVPRIARAASRSAAQREITRAVLAGLVLYAPIAVAWLAVPGPAIAVLLSGEFAGIVPLLPLQIAGDVLKAVCAVLVLACAALLRPGFVLLAEVVFSAVFVASTWGLTPGHHARGAVGAYTIAYAVLLFVLFPLVRRAIRVLPP